MKIYIPYASPFVQIFDKKTCEHKMIPAGRLYILNSYVIYDRRWIWDIYAYMK